MTPLQTYLSEHPLMSGVSWRPGLIGFSVVGLGFADGWGVGHGPGLLIGVVGMLMILGLPLARSIRLRLCLLILFELRAIWGVLPPGPQPWWGICAVGVALKLTAEAICLDGPLSRFLNRSLIPIRNSDRDST